MTGSFRSLRIRDKLRGCVTGRRYTVRHHPPHRRLTNHMTSCDPATDLRSNECWPDSRSAPARTSSGRARRGLMAAAAVVCVFVSLVAPASSAPDPVATAEARLAAATADRVEADATVAEVRARRQAATERLAELGHADEQLTEEIAQARRELREFAVAAYIDGGQAAIFRSSLDPAQAQALSWQANLSLEQSSSAGDAASRFADLKESNEPEKVDAAEELDRLAVELQAAEFDQIQAAAFERDAESSLAAARAARQAAQERAAREQAAAARAAAAPSSSGGAGRSSSAGSSGERRGQRGSRSCAVERRARQPDAVGIGDARQDPSVRVPGQLLDRVADRPLPRCLPVRPHHLAWGGRFRRPSSGVTPGTGLPGAAPAAPAGHPPLAALRPLRPPAVFPVTAAHG